MLQKKDKTVPAPGDEISYEDEIAELRNQLEVTMSELRAEKQRSAELEHNQLELDRDYTKKMTDMQRERFSFAEQIEDRLRQINSERDQESDRMARQIENLMERLDKTETSVKFDERSSNCSPAPTSVSGNQRDIPRVNLPQSSFVPPVQQTHAMQTFSVPPPRQIIYDGKTTWESFIRQFQSIAVACGWNEQEMLFRILSSLRGEATSVSYLAELENRRQGNKEKLAEYVADIKRLVFKGYPSLLLIKQRETQLACAIFFEGCMTSKLRLLWE